MKAVPGILPTLLEMICFFSTPTIDVEPKKLLFMALSSVTTGYFRHKKTLKPIDFKVFVELLGRFELPTSSLPRMRSTD